MNVNYQAVDRLQMNLLDLIMGITLTLSHIESVGDSPDQNLLLTAIVPKSFSDIKHNSVTKNLVYLDSNYYTNY